MVVREFLLDNILCKLRLKKEGAFLYVFVYVSISVRGGLHFKQ